MHSERQSLHTNGVSARSLNLGAAVAVAELECGASRTEQEHYDGETIVGQRPNDETISLQHSTIRNVSSIDALRDLLASDVLTENDRPTMFTSPHTLRQDHIDGTKSTPKNVVVPLVYCDQTASNRPVKSIERYMERVCLPLYGNTHTNTSITGSQSTAFVAEARQIVAEETNAKITGKASLDVVLFAGNGATSAVELLIDCLGLKQLALENRDQRPVVFIGPYEHHSNLIPWRETGCEIVMIPECPVTHTVDVAFLDRVAPDYASRFTMGTFTAASNVTGKLCNVNLIAETLHRHGALAFFDYATASAYTKVDMNPTTVHSSATVGTELSLAKDAVFLSPHKMLGGVGTPGVLIVKKHLVNQVNAPSRSGGGTVFYVTHTHHRFLSNRIERYEGGTPNVAGIIRVGLTFLLKRQAEAKFVQVNQRADPSTSLAASIVDFDCSTYSSVTKRLKEHAPNLVLLGSDEGGQNLPIFSFLIRCGPRFLHYNYVCAILNDVFGIQSRGGCQCAGPYSQRLLGLAEQSVHGDDVPSINNEEIEDALYRFKERAELLRPGYTRLSLPFKGTRAVETEYVVKALAWVAENGWALMCQYRCNHRTGEWRHSSRQGKPLGRDEKRWLSRYSFGERDVPATLAASPTLVDILDATFRNAGLILASAKADRRSIVEAIKMADTNSGLGEVDDCDLERLRWYMTPKECATLLSGEPEPGRNEILGALYPRSAHLPDRDKRFNDRKRKHSPVAVNQYSAADSGDMTTLEPGTVNISSRVIPSNAHADTEVNSDDVPKSKRNENSVPGNRDHPLASVVKTCGSDSAKMLKKSSRTSDTWGHRVESTHPSVPTHQGKDNASMDSVLSAVTTTKKQRFKHMQPPSKLMRTVTQAIVQWGMIQEGDRLLLGLSGGKDSLSLLHCLLELQRKMPIKFAIEVCTIDPMTPSFDPSPLIPYVESLGLKYHYIRDDIVSRAGTAGKSGEMVSSLCAFCARMKRGNLYNCARTNQCNKLVLAQHLDDCAESTFMSMMHNGFLRTMKANYSIDAGDISVIRPLIYCRESLMTDFAKAKGLPVINENCPACFEEPKERARIKKLLSREESLYPNLMDCIRRSLIPLMHDDMAGIFRSYTEETLARSRKVPYKQRQPAKQEVSEGKQATSDNVSPSRHALLADATEEELLRELALRKSNRYKASVATNASRNRSEDGMTTIPDLTGQVCTLHGGNGSIPCRELME